MRLLSHNPQRNPSDRASRAGRYARRLAEIAGDDALGPLGTHAALLAMGLQPLSVLNALLKAWAHEPLALRRVLALAAEWASGIRPQQAFQSLEKRVIQIGLNPVSLALAAEGTDIDEAWSKAQRILARLSGGPHRLLKWADVVTSRSLVQLARYITFGEVKGLGLDFKDNGLFALPKGLWVPGSVRLTDCPYFEGLGANSRIGQHLILRGCPSFRDVPSDLAVDGVMDLRGTRLRPLDLGAPAPSWMPKQGLILTAPSGGTLFLVRGRLGQVEELPPELTFGSYPA